MEVTATTCSACMVCSLIAFDCAYCIPLHPRLIGCTKGAVYECAYICGTACSSA